MKFAISLNGIDFYQEAGESAFFADNIETCWSANTFDVAQDKLLDLRSSKNLLIGLLWWKTNIANRAYVYRILIRPVPDKVIEDYNRNLEIVKAALPHD